MNLVDIITLSFPDAKSLVDFEITENEKGTFISFWNEETLGTKPTESELQALANQHQADYDNKQNLKLRKKYGNALQLHIDQIAQSKDYKDSNSCASYVNSTNLVWKTESIAFVAWRDTVWSYAYQVLDDVINNGATLPSVNEFIANAPVITW